MYEHTRDTINAYQDYFHAGGRRRDPITNAYDYVQKFGPKDPDINESLIDQNADLWKEAPLDIHSRMFPYNGQEYMILLNNPGMVQRVSKFISQGEGRRLQKAGNDFQRRSKISAHYFPEWVDGHPGWRRLFNVLNKTATDLQVGPRDTRERYIQAEVAKRYRESEPDADLPMDTEQGLYGDFYITNTHKFSTPRSSHVWDSAVRSVDTEYFPKELEIAQPKTAIVMGGVAWWVFESAVGVDSLTPIGDSVFPDNFNHYSGGVFEWNDGFAVVVRHPAMLHQISETRLLELFNHVSEQGGI